MLNSQKDWQKSSRKFCKYFSIEFKIFLVENELVIGKRGKKEEKKKKEIWVGAIAQW